MYDLAIIGGGPAGTTAAITAARYGARVLLLEKGSFPRNKVCGEFVSAESLALLGSLLPQGCDLIKRAPRIQRTRVFIENRVLQAPIEPAAASIARTEFDAALWKSARGRGVDAREHQSVFGVEGEGPFLIKIADEQFTSHSIIDTSGRWSNLNHGKNGNGSLKWLGVKAHFREENPTDSVDLYFFEGGYCGVQPVGSDGDNRINVCAMIRGDIGSSLEETFERHVELKKRSQSWKRLTDVVATSPLLFHDPAPRRGNILCAGDAAGFVDPFVGDGISLALRSGALAARCLRSSIQGNGALQQAAQSYDRAYRRDLSHIFKSSSTIRRLFSFPAPIRAAILYTLVTFPTITRRMIRKTR